MTKSVAYFEKDTIVEALLELRFDSNHNPHLVPGLIYGHDKIRHDFGQPEQVLPGVFNPWSAGPPPANQMQIPTVKFRSEDGSSLLVGGRVVAFSVLTPYPRWEKFSTRIFQLLSVLKELKLYTRVTDINLRYLNIFDFDLSGDKSPLDLLDINLKIGKQAFIGKYDPPGTSSSSFSIRMDELIDECGCTIVCVSHGGVRLPAPSAFNKQGAVLDISVTRSFNGNEFLENPKSYVDATHDVEKKLFLNFLSDHAKKVMGIHYE